MVKCIKIIFDVLFRLIPIQVINIVTGILPNHMATNYIKGFLYRPYFKKCGRRLQIGKGVIINGMRNMEIGNDCYLSHYSYINAKEGIVLDNNVIIGPFSVLVTTNHERIDGVVQNTSNKGGKITIGKGAFLGAHCVVTPNVTIGEKTMIGANAVVTRNVNDDCKAFGVPAKCITNKPEQE